MRLFTSHKDFNKEGIATRKIVFRDTDPPILGVAVWRSFFKKCGGVARKFHRQNFSEKKKLKQENVIFVRKTCIDSSNISFSFGFFGLSEHIHALYFFVLKRLARILYLCFCTRIAMEFHFEFGFKESNLVRRSFHVINTL